MTTTHTKKQGFTIIETLVAITVLMIAIAGPLVVASKGMTGAIASRDQMIASYLAQESIEKVKNLKDNSVYSGLSWLNGVSGCSKISPCDASAIDISPIATGLSTYPLYIVTGSYYRHSSNSATRSPFSRYFYLSIPGSDQPCQDVFHECTITVVLDWTEGTLPYEVSIGSEMTDTPR